MAEPRQLDCVVRDFHPHDPATLGQPELCCRGEVVDGQMALRLRSVGLGVGQPHLAVDREKEACAERVRNAQKIAEVHRLGYPVDTDCEIAAHGPSALRYE